MLELGSAAATKTSNESLWTGTETGCASSLRAYAFQGRSSQPQAEPACDGRTEILAVHVRPGNKWLRRTALDTARKPRQETDTRVSHCGPLTFKPSQPFHER
jgi:hypothetical protein